MKNKLIYIIFYLVFSINLFSQGNIDSVNVIEIRKINQEKNEITKINRYPNEDKEVHFIYDKKYSLKEERLFKNNICVGLKKYTLPDFKLAYEIDYLTGDYIDYRKTKGEFYEIKNQAKKNADSVLNLFFSNEFIKKNIRCDYFKCFYYDKDYFYHSWFEQCDVLPKIFCFYYYIIFDSNHKYSLIKFRLDLEGNISYTKHPEGFEYCQKYINFGLNSDEIIEIAKNEKFPIEDTSFNYLLRWIPEESNDFIGSYEILCTYLIKTRKYKKNNKIFIEEIYNSLTLNPWTGEIKCKKKIKRTGEITQKVIWLDGFY